ncbi:hypothetical protein N9478_10370 [Gammaproteobacteria bacterium]|nr:hypothetical protein [Gammaproteobacteria bacterium]
MIDAYDEWNLLLLSEYFNEANHGERVWIQTSREELNSFGFRLGGAKGLIEAVKSGPSWCKDSTDLVYLAWKLRSQRRGINQPEDYGDPGNYSERFENLDAPTYLPYLALWVLAASEEGGSGFYHKVSQLSGLFFESDERTRETIWFLWSDLDEWSSLLDGGLGKFSAVSLGAHTYVGLAKAQALLTQRDRQELPRLFVMLGLRPNQKLSDQSFQKIINFGQDQYFLSNGLREAFRNESRFGDAVREILNARLAEWDGRWINQSESRSFRHRYTSGTSIENEEVSQEEILPLSVVLSVSIEGWELGFRVNAHISGGQFKLNCFESEFAATIDSFRDTIDCLNDSNSAQCAAWNALEHTSKDEGLQFEASYISDDDNSKNTIKTILVPDACHSLAWTNSRHEQKLVEVPLPISGPILLLTSDELVESTLNKYGIDHKELTGEDRSGLPENWQILEVREAEELTPEMRSAIQRLTGDRSGAEIQPRIRFVSGCVIMRGGNRQFADYDLPLVEVEMPKGAILQSEGLSLINIDEGNLGDNKNYSEFYRIERIDRQRYQYTITVSLSSEILRTAKLKVAPSGVHSDAHRIFSIGSFGDSLKSDDGLKGILIEKDTKAISVPPSLRITIDQIQEDSALTVQVLDPHSKLACLFLDMVAQKGSILYGDVKRLLARLVQNLRIADLPLMKVVFDLQSLGYLDIEKDQKGHMLRVHSTPPAIFKLAYDESNGIDLWGVSGTLTLLQWESLVTDPNLDVQVTDDLVPSLRFTSGEMKAVAEELGINLLMGTSDSILTFSCSLEDFKTMLLSQHGFDQHRPRNLERLRPERATFSSDSGLMKIDKDRAFELFRLDDPVIPKMKVYMLGNYGEAGSIYSFIPDSRWAIWMATTSFGVMLYEKYNNDIAYPWPLCYLSESADLFIPARMKPPMLIDRALCVASGYLPEELYCKLELNSESSESYTIYPKHNAAFKITNVPEAYFDMAEGLWLRYRLVPEDLTKKVAEKLSCYVHYLS